MKNSIITTLAEGKSSVGSWLNLASPLAAEVMAAAGFPWLVVDAEHTAFDMDLIAHTFRAIEARGAIPLARAWDHDPVTVARLLDAGAWGLVFPHVSTPEQAERLAAWCSHDDFVSDYGTLCLARSNAYYDAADYKGYNSNDNHKTADCRILGWLPFGHVICFTLCRCL